MVDFVRMLGNNKVKTEKCRFHSIEAHNFHIRRFGRCLYCDMGSRVVHKSLIKEK